MVAQGVVPDVLHLRANVFLSAMPNSANAVLAALRKDRGENVPPPSGHVTQGPTSPTLYPPSTSATDISLWATKTRSLSGEEVDQTEGLIAPIDRATAALFASDNDNVTCFTCCARDVQFCQGPQRKMRLDKHKIYLAEKLVRVSMNKSGPP